MKNEKHLLKKLLLLSMIMSVMAAALAGCGSKTKTLTMGQVSIDLPEDFEIDTSNQEAFDALARNDSTAFGAVNETQRGMLDGLTVSSLKTFAEFDYATRQLGNITVTDELTQRNDYYYFSFTGGNSSKYVYCFFEKEQNYWLCIFSCKNDDYSTKDMLKWADTIEIH